MSRRRRLAASRALRRGALLCLVAACGDAERAQTSQDAVPVVTTEARALVGSAPLIVTARVAEITPGRVTSGLAFSDVRFDVERTLKGVAPEALVLEQADPGGTVVGSARYAEGERYLLLLRPSQTEEGRQVAVSQGSYELEDGRVRATTPGPVADTWDGAQAETVLALIEQLREDANGP